MSNLLSLVQSVPAVLLADGSFWLPPPDSATAPEVDFVFYMILGISAFFFALVTAAMVYFAIVYRRRPGHREEKTATSSMVLELTWTIIPVLIVAYIFYAGFSAYMQMQSGPQNSYEILVKAQKWDWFFTYPNGYVSSDLHLPVDQPIKLIMSSEDVIHSLYIPAFRVKMDCVPGRYTYAWLRATEVTPPDEPYGLFCTEYCGDSHFNMLANVVVHKAGDFDAWLENAANYLKDLPPAEAGAVVFGQRCAQCHSIDGTAKTGPTFQGSFGADHKMRDGSTVKVDENYIRESIMAPGDKVRDGYQAVMPTFKGILSDAEIGYLIEYIKTLK